MFKKSQSSVLDYQKKNRKKTSRTIIQLGILFVVGFLLFNALIDFRKYEEPDKSQWTNKKGFVALSYFGVDRNGTPKLIEKSQLNKQLKSLYEQGYQTISQQDVIDFYEKGKALPEKALFLSFEDGRNDSSIFAHPILKKYNYKATFLSYANKVGSKDNKFLQPKDMLEMKKSGFWELGSNGYRLTYINIFDREGKHVGMKDENDVTNKEHIEYYNHYLMDFIRDENMIPIENKEEMESRIMEDYKLMEEIYTKEFGFVPNVYMIMHANALYGGMNNLVTKVNDEEIKKIFNIHFNLEGNAYNKSGASVMNLSRVQPAPYWYTNHLLMKIQKDTSQKMEFLTGDEKRAAKWKQFGGVSEFMDNRIILTSPPAKEGKLQLTGSEDFGDIKFTANLEGNVVGRQSIYLRNNEEKKSYVQIMLENNKVIVKEKVSGKIEKELGVYELDEIEKRIKDITFDKASVYTKGQTMGGARTPEDEYQVNIKGTRQFEIIIQENKLSVQVDEKTILDNQEINEGISKGSVAIGAQYHKQNKKDDIYDGVFDDIIITSIKDDNEEEVLFENTLNSYQQGISSILKYFDNVTNWVIDTF
ncbi:polysaccharide deacetylase family protein [Psychrobacillus sp.]|uniref:polysaccharide deacetylase family protein n=1 Tax=Psychrobacillus sp. TaxID=1871623 RepID=UPI0028BDBA24|nr:polysaccharide deacetylase family protein [Psychrobacillus sp.]